MRWLCAALTLFAASASVYLGVSKTTFASYSSEQLDQLEKAYRGASGHDDAHDLMIEERRRRLALPICLGATAVLFLGAVFAPGGNRRRKLTDEEGRLLEQVGPLGSLAPDRKEAALTLGVDPKAPDTVIEAAYRAQLSTLPANPVGLDPGMQRLVQERRDRLARARDLLLNPLHGRTASVK
jgi:hypothetical protein